MALAEQLEFFARTDTGRKRKHNEDNFLVDRDLRLFVVADGMGGHAAGEVASAIAVRTVHEVVSARRDLLQDRNSQGPRSEVSQREILSLLELAVQEASRRIHADAQSDTRKRGMGTTVSLLLLVESSAYVAHVGDSRVYLVRDGQAHPVTEDHTIANELIRLGIVAAEAVHKVPNKNAITRAVGVYEHVEVDTLNLEVLPADQFVLASDGLCGYLDERKVGLIGYVEDDDGERAVDALVGFANDQGGKDNITVVLVRVGSGDGADTARAKRLALKREMLMQMPLFSRLNEREVLRVMQVAEVYELEKGEHVVRQGEEGDRMYVTLQGRLQVSTEGSVLGELGPGEHFGEMSLIRSRPRSADVRALEPSLLITIKRDDFFEIIRTEHRIAVKLLWQFLGVLANRLERTSRELSAARGDLDASHFRQVFIDEEPSLDPFAGPHAPPPRSSLGSSRPVTLPGIDDIEAPHAGRPGSGEPTPISFESIPEAGGAPTPNLQAAPVMAERLDSAMRQRAATQTGLGPRPEGNADTPRVETPRLEDAPDLAAPRDAPEAEPVDEAGPETQPRPRKITRKIPVVHIDPSHVETVPDRALQGPVVLSEKKTVPAMRIRNETLKSAGENRHATIALPDAPQSDEASEDGQAFQPTKRTIPLQPTEDFQKELAELRKEFKARLAKARKDREENE